jgi:hypothetical protein
MICLHTSKSVAKLVWSSPCGFPRDALNAPSSRPTKSTCLSATWLDYTLHFVSPDECGKLDVPADKDMAAYENNNGYTMTALEEAVNASDPLAFKPFRPASVAIPSPRESPLFTPPSRHMQSLL